MSKICSDCFLFYWNHQSSDILHKSDLLHQCKRTELPYQDQIIQIIVLMTFFINAKMWQSNIKKKKVVWGFNSLKQFLRFYCNFIAFALVLNNLYCSELCFFPNQQTLWCTVSCIVPKHSSNIYLNTVLHVKSTKEFSFTFSYYEMLSLNPNRLYRFPS